MRKLVLLSLFASPWVHAEIIDDGAIHVLETILAEDVFIRNGSTLRMQGNAAVQGGGVPAGTVNAAAVSVSQNSWTSAQARSSLELTDHAHVAAGANQRGITLNLGADVRMSGDSRVTGNIGTSSSVGSRTELGAAHRLYLQDRAAVDGNVSLPGFLRMSDDSRVTGNVTNASAGDVGVRMTGGTIGGVLRVGSLDSGQIDLTGGSIIGGISTLPSFVDLNMSGGYVGGAGLQFGGQANVLLTGGKVEGGISLAPISSSTAGLGSRIVIEGGRLDASVGDWLIDLAPGVDAFVAQSSYLEIRGGELGLIEAGLGIRLDHETNFDIFGAGLSFAGGWLSGFLADGNWLNLALTFASTWTGSFNIHDVGVPIRTSVPEPGTLGLFGLALLGAAFVRRRRLVCGQPPRRTPRAKLSAGC